MLRAAGIEVRVGARAGEALELNAGFVSRIRRGRPLLTLKLATTLDGKTAMTNGQSRWITGEAARAHVHLQRARHDAVLIGSGTALADDPELTCRLPGMESKKVVRVVIDGGARLAPDSKLVVSAHAHPVWILCAQSADPKARASLAAKGVKVLTVPASPSGLDLAAAMKSLGDEGLTRVLVESGGTLATSFVKASMVDRLLWYRAPTLMGEGLSPVGALGLAALDEMPRFVREGVIPLGEDTLETFRPAP
jgi:diaminohydroxyphosphoribosylaminopyrimidine deaminase/5-amino-6-(5-phosphoribosylamino)uracil reductase